MNKQFKFLYCRICRGFRFMLGLFLFYEFVFIILLLRSKALSNFRSRNLLENLKRYDLVRIFLSNFPSIFNMICNWVLEGIPNSGNIEKFLEVGTERRRGNGMFCSSSIACIILYIYLTVAFSE